MRSIPYVLLFAISVSFIAIPANAQTYESHNSIDYLFLEINGEKANGIIRVSEKIITLQEDVKIYKNGNFKLRAFDNSILLVGNPSKVTVIDLRDNFKASFDLRTVDTQSKRIEPKEPEEIVGPLHVETLKKLEAEKLAQEQEEERLEEIKDRSKSKTSYVLSDDKELKINLSSPKRIPYYDTFDFEFRIVDPVINKFSNYWEKSGYIDGVEITSTIKDPDGEILNEFKGTTSNKGTFHPENQTSFSYNTFQTLPYTLEIMAKKYFDEDATYSISSLIKEFYVYTPIKNSPRCDPGFVYDPDLDQCIVI